MVFGRRTDDDDDDDDGDVVCKTEIVRELIIAVDVIKVVLD